ncbi:manganese/divalent cation transporter [Desulfosarcina cetonica]|uniref:Nramp family divalent metal transporter n=1 Tax=Desulfosarcina cetonica TaxID=90730 RepID=UPI0009FA48C1|nr:Nramp family divalent metal transporter [Desulfosarcina cetonica]VTR71022.1 manganese/divalent cation transporter [Desulfosarcina cetonica]
MEKSEQPGNSEISDAAAQALSGTGAKRGLARLWPFLGPAFIASIAYVDPGNFATNIQGGAQFGYLLLWVVVASNLMAMLIQTLSAKLGIATGYNLAELCRLHYPAPVVWIMWVLMELVAIATDLAEFLGAALGFNLLLGIPLWMAGILTALVTFMILMLQHRGFRSLEMLITAMLGVIAICYLVETILDQPDWGPVAYHAVVPGFAGPESVLLATGILGATVMPHVIFLHSSLTQGRIVVHDPVQRRRLFHFELADVTIAMAVAGFVNAAMLIMAAATFHRAGMVEIASIEAAHKTLEPLLGSSARWIFAVSLLAAGLSSTTVGTMAGQVVMQGFIERHIPVWLRRLVTIAPSLVVIFMGLDPTRTLVISQVVLSFGLPFAVIPLVQFSSRADLMGILVNRRITTITAGAVAGLIILLNIYLLVQTFLGG